MTTEEFFQAVQDSYASAMWSEDFPPLADLDGMTLRELDGLLIQLETLARTVRQMRKHAEGQMSFILGDGGAARIGDTIYRNRPNPTTRITDPAGLADWLRDDWPHVVPVTASTELRKGGVKAVCDRRGVDPQTFWETFTETTVGEMRVERLPIDKAPKFLQRLEDGETI